MVKNKKILVVGGDLRNIYLANLLKVNNKIYTLGFETLDKVSSTKISLDACKTIDFDYIILPINPVKDGILSAPFSDAQIYIDDVLNLCGERTMLLAGMIDTSLKSKIEERDIEYADYFIREELQILNAVPTAQGAIHIACEELPYQFKNANILIAGYGRIGKVLSRLSSLLGADVSVAARKVSDLAWIEVNGHKPVKFDAIKDCIGTYDIIFNTVPKKVFSKDLLSKVKKDCLIIDLASNPGGIDLEAGKALNLNIIWALSLPGKVAPATAGKIIYDTILNIISERRLQSE